ncbi:MAG: PilZ domain-containing protein [Desulfamplus sp.]|nr:PilZ domain-containing protein [Desulfamplus sp.]
MFDFLKFIKANKRSSERVPVKVMFKYHYDNRDYMGLLRDICLNGFGFLSSNEIEPGKEIDMEVVVQCKDCTLEKWVALKEKAKIKWVAPNHSARLADYDVGCEFTQPDKEMQEKLNKMLEELSEYSNKK